MSELTVNEIVKIVIGVLLLVVVIGGVYLVFKDRIVSYFTGFSPPHEVDATSAFGQELIQDKNIVATLFLSSSSNYITLVGPPPRQTQYYFVKNSDRIKKDIGVFSSLSWRGVFGADQEVGTIDGTGKVVIVDVFLSDADLQKIRGAYRNRGGLYILR